MSTAGSKTLFLGHLKGPLSALHYLTVSLMIYLFYYIDKASVHNFADDNSLSAFNPLLHNVEKWPNIL